MVSQVEPQNSLQCEVKRLFKTWNSCYSAPFVSAEWTKQAKEVEKETAGNLSTSDINLILQDKALPVNPITRL